EQLLPSLTVRRIFAFAEHNILPSRERLGLNRPCRFRRRAVGMNPHVAEVLAEPRFEKPAQGWRQGLSAPTQSGDLRMNSGRRLWGGAGPLLTPKHVLLFAMRAETAIGGTGGAFAAKRPRGRRRNNATGDLVCLPFLRIVRTTDCELRLDSAR